MTQIALVDPGDNASITIDWSDGIGTAALASVAHSLPSGLTLVSQSTDTEAGTSAFRFTGWQHGQTYSVECVATLDTGEVLNRNLTVRCFNG